MLCGAAACIGTFGFFLGRYSTTFNAALPSVAARPTAAAELSGEPTPEDSLVDGRPGAQVVRVPLRDDQLACGEREDDHEELREVPERRLEQARHGRAEALPAWQAASRMQLGDAPGAAAAMRKFLALAVPAWTGPSRPSW